jgi:hypothetical protein
MDVTIYAFVKFGAKVNLESLRKTGAMYMNTLGYFIKLESMSGDKDEGMNNFYQGSKTKAIIIPHGQGNAAPIKGLISMGSKKGDDLERNVFCLHAITDTEPKLHPNNLKRNDHALVITSPSVFLKMLKDAAEQKTVAFQQGFVKYVDRKTHHGEMGCFFKFKEFESENEFRILKKQGTGEPYIFEIGNLESISVIVKKENIESYLKELVSKR